MTLTISNNFRIDNHNDLEKGKSLEISNKQTSSKNATIFLKSLHHNIIN